MFVVLYCLSVHSAILMTELETIPFAAYGSSDFSLTHWRQYDFAITHTFSIDTSLSILGLVLNGLRNKKLNASIESRPFPLSHLWKAPWFISSKEEIQITFYLILQIKGKQEEKWVLFLLSSGAPSKWHSSRNCLLAPPPPPPPHQNCDQWVRECMKGTWSNISGIVVMC